MKEQGLDLESLTHRPDRQSLTKILGDIRNWFAPATKDNQDNPAASENIQRRKKPTLLEMFPEFGQIPPYAEFIERKSTPHHYRFKEELDPDSSSLEELQQVGQRRDAQDAEIFALQDHPNNNPEVERLPHHFFLYIRDIEDLIKELFALCGVGASAVNISEVYRYQTDRKDIGGYSRAAAGLVWIKYLLPHFPDLNTVRVAKTIPHELMHGTGIVIVGSQGAEWRGHSDPAEGLDNASVLEEALAQWFDARCEPLIAYHFPAEYQLRQQLIEENKKEDSDPPIDFIEDLQTGELKISNRNVEGSIELFDLLISKVPRFLELVLQARVTGDHKALSNAINDAFNDPQSDRRQNVFYYLTSLHFKSTVNILNLLKNL